MSYDTPNGIEINTDKFDKMNLSHANFRIEELEEENKQLKELLLLKPANSDGTRCNNCNSNFVVCDGPGIDIYRCVDCGNKSTMAELI